MKMCVLTASVKAEDPRIHSIQWGLTPFTPKDKKYTSSVKF